MRNAIEKSCNTFFYTVGNMLGVDKMYKWSEKLGLALKSGIDLPNEQESIVPSTEWKLKRTGERWYPGETISVAIGQGQLAVTPISMAVMMATVANGGTRVVPRLVKAYDEGKGWVPVPTPPSPFTPFLMKPETVVSRARRSLAGGQWRRHRRPWPDRRPRRIRQDRHGAGDLASGRERARGKTDQDLRDHGWFVFMAPKDNPELAGVVFSEHGEHGYFSATVAKHVIETYFAQRDGLPMPALPLPPTPPVTPPVRAVATVAGGTH